jgi:hypothetical protein
VLILHVEGEPFVQAVRLDDPSPGYAETYAHAVARHLDQDKVLRYVEVHVSSVAELGPDDIAAMLTTAGREEFGVPDLPQVWERVADWGER